MRKSSSLRAPKGRSNLIRRDCFALLRFRLAVLAMTAFSMFLLMTGLSSPVSAEPEVLGDAAPRAMWVWKSDPINDERVRSELFKLCNRTAVHKLFLPVGGYPLSEQKAVFQEKIGKFLQECHAQGIQIHALEGDPLWALKRYHFKVLRSLEGYLQFNRGRPSTQRIDGFQLDIEPYALPQWKTGYQELLKRQLLDLVIECRRMIDQERDGHPLLLGIAVPFFYDRDPEFEKALLSQVDYIALMAYFDTGAEIIKKGRSHVEEAAQAGKKIIIGVETQDIARTGQGERRNTFYEEGWEEMERQLAEVVASFSGGSSFDGLAIHAYDSYRVLQRERKG